MHVGVQRVGGDGGEVEQAAARLGPVDLLQPEHVGVEVGDRGGDPFGVYGAVGQRPAVQQVEGGQAHGVDPNERVVQVFIKALCCAAVVFVVLALAGMWLQKRRGR